MSTNTKPFLKYLGNKFNQVEQIKKLIPQGERLIEPFVGSGSVFLNTNYRRYLLCDVNKDLINVYKVLAAYQEEFVERCRKYFTQLNNNVDIYNFHRHVFNQIDSEETNYEQRINKACLFIYLNKHGFRGITRYNSEGKFNVPFGYYEKPYFPEQEMLAFVAKINQAELVEFRAFDFKDTLKLARAGDVVYCDPPYVPLSATSNFTRYYGETFNWHDQVELLSLCKKLKQELNITSVISNHNTNEVVTLYETSVMEMVKGFVKRSINPKRAINAPELMVSI